MAFPVYAVVAIPVIFVLGLAGALTPPTIAHFFPKYGITQKYYFSFFNGLAAGLILAVGFMHSIPDAAESYESALPPEEERSQAQEYPWWAFLAMMGALMCFTFEEIIETLSSVWGVAHLHSHGAPHHHHHHPDPHHVAKGRHRSRTNSATRRVDPLTDTASLTDADCGDSYGACEEDAKVPLPGNHPEGVTEDVEAGCKDHADDDEEKARQAERQAHASRIIKMIVLFFGLMFHNMFIGIALGSSDNDYQLFIAVLFHQFFEGLGMGSRVAAANLHKFLVILAVDVAFAIVPPIGIGIGIGVKAALDEGSSTYSFVDGTFQALSGGILIYVAVMHMIRGYQEVGVQGTALHIHKLSSYIVLLIGAGAMSAIGIWA